MSCIQEMGAVPQETDAAEAEKWRNAIADLLKGINNPEYLRRIYFFSKSKSDRESKRARTKKEG